MSDIDDHPYRRSSSSDGRGQAQSSRIKTFFRQNRNNNPKLILVSLLYTMVASIYFYNLLFVDVGSGVDARKYVDKTIKDATAPIYKSNNSKDNNPIIKLQPRSLADITIANVEVALKNQDNIVEMRRMQDERKEEFKRKKIELMEIRKATENRKSVLAAASVAAVNGSIIIDSGEKQQTLELLKEAALSSNTTAVEDAADLEYIKKITSMHVQRTPLKRNITKRQRTSSTDDGIGGFLPFLMMVWFCSMCRLFARVVVPSGSSNRSGDSAEDVDDEEDNVADGASIFLTMGGGRDAMRLRRRLRTAQANRRFQRFVDRLNEERVENGERQISAETLRHLVNTRDFNGNDYDQLHSFADENGPAMGSWFSQVGATVAEINRCPSRTLRRNDELLRPKRSSESGHQETPSCSVCLESYREGETVRTIPCFHTFHKSCIDPWLAEKAECPICKHSAIG